MNFTPALFLAQAADAAQQPNPLTSMIPLVLIFVIFYFLLIRPQQKRAKQQAEEHAKLIASLATGDKVITNSGMHGIVANVKEKTVLIKVADNVKIEFDRTAIISADRNETVSAEVVKA